MNDEKNLLIQAVDHYGDCLSDKSFGVSTKSIERPKGFVEIFEILENGKKKLIGKENLVIYLGREWLLSRAFNTQNANIAPLISEFICWFGVGDDGCTVADPLTPISPTNLDTELNNPIMINGTDVSFADYRTLPDAGYYKAPFDSVTFEQDADNENSWLIMNVSTTLGILDANGFNLSEAGLYTATSDAGGSIGPFNLYARVTFSSVVKSAARQILFVWYVYF